MKKYNISTNLIRVTKDLYNVATSAVLFNSSILDWFQKTVGVRQGCLLAPTLFNIFLERIMTDALNDHEGTVSIEGRTITNLRFADDIDGLAGEEEELANLVALCKLWKLDATARYYASHTKTMLPTRKSVRQVLEGNGKQGKMEKTGCKIICGASTTLAVKRLMMMMMMIMMMMMMVVLTFTSLSFSVFSKELIPRHN